MSYRFLEHPTDAVVEVTAPTLKEAFLKAAESVVDLTLDTGTVVQRERVQVTVNGKDLDYLLLNWLEEVIYQLITEGFAIGRFEVSISRNGGYRLDASMYGEPIDLHRHGFKVEIKAPTFHRMEIRRGRSVEMRFLLDL